MQADEQSVNKIRLPQYGHPGCWTVLGGWDTTSGGDTSNFDVIFFLSIPGLEVQKLGDDGYSVEILTGSEGDSPFHFSDLPANAAHPLQMSSPNKPGVSGTARVNRFSRLASVAAHSLDAGNPALAAQLASEYILPSLNRLSLFYDVGFCIPAIMVVDNNSGYPWMYHYLPFGVVSITTAEFKRAMPELLVPFVSLYREAISSTNSYYELVKLINIAEGITETITGFKKFRPYGLKDERLPDKPFVPTDWRRKKIGDYWKYIRTHFRHSIAHFMDDKTEIIGVPDYVCNMIESAKVLPALRYSVRVLIGNERLRMLEAMRQSGEVVIMDDLPEVDYDNAFLGPPT